MEIFLSNLVLLNRLFNKKEVGIQIFKGKSKLVKDHQTFQTVNSNKLQINVSEDHIRNPQGEILIDFRHHNEKNRFRNKKTFAFINNPEGKMQWIFPVSLKKPLFLKSHFSDQKSILKRGLIKLLYKIRLDSLYYDGKFTVYYDSPLYLEEILNYFSYTDYLINANLLSSYKTIHITTFTDKKAEFHIKLAMNATSLANISNEYNILKKLNRNTYQYFNLPGCLQFEDQNFIIMRDRVGSGKSVNSEINRKHVLALNEIYRDSLGHRYLSQLLQESWIRLNYVRKIIKSNPVIEINQILEKASHLYEMLSLNEILIPVGLMNGNFSPGNMVNDERILLINWELASYNKPLLSDLFHFVMIETSRKDGTYKDVKNEIDRLYQMNYVQALIQSYQIDYFLHFQLYLLGEISYRLPFVAEEIAYLNNDTKCILKIWLQALETMVGENKPVREQLSNY